MNRCLLFFIILLFSLPTASHAQIATYQLSLRDSTLDILYVGINNKVMIQNLPANAKVRFDGKLITPQRTETNKAASTQNFILLADREGSKKLQVFNKDSVQIYSKEFMIYRAKDPVVQLGFAKDSIAAVNAILLNPSLVTYIPDSYLKPYWRIVAYRVTLYIGTEVETKYHESRSGFNNLPFDEQAQKGIASMKKGDRIVIEDIKVFTGDEIARSFRPIKITIK